MQLKAILLDLDGTLVDTAPDMVSTLNRILKQHGEAQVTLSDAGKLVSNGAKALLDFGFPSILTDKESAQFVQEFLINYAEHVSDQSIIYDGMQEVLETCLEYNLRWGVVTNKPLELSRSLLKGLNLLDSCSILLGGDSLPVKKPDPAPLLHCCMVLNLAASECLYVGDHERDVIAGNSAGMDTAVALWGYINNDQTPEDWNSNYLINQPVGLLHLIKEKLSN